MSVWIAASSTTCGGVDDHAQRVFGGDAVEERAERLRVGGVAGGDGDVGAESGEFGGEFGGSVGVRAAAAGEHEAAGAVRGDQVPGDEPAEGAGAAGDQDRAVGVDGACLGRGGDAGESLGQHAVAAERELGLVAVDRLGLRPVDGCAVVEVDEHEPPGVFGLGGADEAASGGDGQVVDVLVAAGGDGAAGEQDEPGAGQALVG